MSDNKQNRVNTDSQIRKQDLDVSDMIQDTGPAITQEALHDVMTRGPGIDDIEQVTGGNANRDDVMRLEAFMEEMVEVDIAQSTDEDALEVVTVSVNGINQPIRRGGPARIKRKFLEVLARAIETRYTDKVMDPNDPSSIARIPRHVHAYPFNVVRDTDQGRAWLTALMAQQNMILRQQSNPQ